MKRAMIVCREKEFCPPVEEQVKQCLFYAKKKGFKVEKENILASDKCDYLYLQQQIRSLAETNQIDCVIVFTYSCVGEDEIDTPSIIKLLLSYHVNVFSTLEGGFL